MEDKKQVDKPQKPMTEAEKKILDDKILSKDKALFDKTKINK